MTLLQTIITFWKIRHRVGKAQVAKVCSGVFSRLAVLEESNPSRRHVHGLPVRRVRVEGSGHELP